MFKAAIKLEKTCKFISVVLLLIMDENCTVNHVQNSYQYQLITSTHCIWVNPYTFNQSFNMTLSDLDKICYICNVCGHKKPYKF